MLTISQQAGDDGRLFGSVTNQDIADAIEEARGVTIDKRKIHLEEPIKNVGTYVVVVEVAEGVTASVKTMVVERKKSAAPLVAAARRAGGHDLGGRRRDRRPRIDRRPRVVRRSRSRDRDDEDAARDFYDLHGRWPDET